ncbi:MAG: hypothetical protein ABI861_05255 [Panacibacter sp.]
MPQEFNQYQIAALQQLADYRSVFKTEGALFTLKTKPVKGTKITLQQFLDSFVDVFCQNNFADTDYSVIQNKHSGYKGFAEWIKDADLSIILQCLTYAIWTDKTYEGYLLRKVNDRSFEILLTRLDNILSENYRQQKVQRTKVTVINTPNASAIKHK